jgi:pilus assembly protein CpaE
MARILVIDDNDDMLTMLQMLLERRGNHKVTTSNNGQDGIDKAFNMLPDVAIVDVMMPGLNGYDVLDRLRSDNRTKYLPIIILTARGQAVDRNAALEAGANSHLSKPVDIQELLSTIDSLLEMKSFANIPERLVLPVFSLRGGVGVTTIAINLALLFQQVAPTILWDLSPSSGHGALNLGMQPKVNWANYLRNPDEAVNTLLLKHSSGLRLLAAPPVPPISTWFTSKLIQDMEKKLLQQCSILIIDMPAFIDNAVATVLQDAHQILLISSDDNPGIQTTLATLQALTSILARKEERNRVMIIRNSVTPIIRNNIDTLQQAIGQPITEDIPFDDSQRAALQKGIPSAVGNPTSPLIGKLKKLAQSILVAV